MLFNFVIKAILYTLLRVTTWDLRRRLRRDPLWASEVRADLLNAGEFGRDAAADLRLI